MTIKRRLFISNIMMLVIPVILSVLTTSLLSFAFIRLFNLGYRDYFSNEMFFYRMLESAQILTTNWSEKTELRQMILELEEGLRSGGGKPIPLAIYKDGKCLYSTEIYEESFVTGLALSQEKGRYFAADNTCVYSFDSGEYRLLLVDTNYRFNGAINNIKNRKDFNTFNTFAAILLLTLLVIISVTNRFLTQLVFRSIVTPLDALVYGVHQIRDGNLSYRITYDSNDEFSAVCADFNEMAVRLYDMVSARQKDEENRKELIAGISHDLRTPLTSIKTYVEGIELGIASTPQIREKYLATIKSKAGDLEHIINQLFMFSKLDVGEFPMQYEHLEIGRWIRSFIENASYEYAQRGLELKLIEPVQNAEVYLDSVQLRNVLANTLENSLKYKNKERGTVEISCRRNDTGVEITLTDDGPGVPDETLEMLFDVFYRTDKARSNTEQGSGLGLAISAKIIERFNGTIRAEKPAVGGLSIVVALPAGEGVEYS